MYKTRFMKITNTLLALVLTGAIQNTEAATYYVKAGSGGGNGTSWTKAFNNLDSALAAASQSAVSDEIRVSEGTYVPAIPYGGGFVGSQAELVTFKLPSKVTIYGGYYQNSNHIWARDPDGHPTILSGRIDSTHNAWHVVTADGVTEVVLDGLNVQDGFADGPDKGTMSVKQPFGGKILTLDYDFGAGGGLFARHGAKVTLNNVDFSNNFADSANTTMFTTGPAIPVASGGGAIAAIDPGTVVTIKASSFMNNGALSFGCTGGALNALLDGTFDVSSSIFSANLASRLGGAIHIRDAGNTSIKSSTFIANETTDFLTFDESGGALALFDTNVIIANCTFQNNRATSAIGAGGALFFHVPFDDGSPYKLTLNNSTFTGNAASSNGGGAITIFGAHPNAGSNATVSNCVFSNNEGGVGGAINVDSVPVTLSNCSFVGNKAWVEGGAIMGSNYSNSIIDITNLNQRAKLTITNSSFMQNTIIGVPVNVFIPPLVIFDATAAGVAAGLGLAPAGVTEMNPGGGAVASEFGGNVQITNSSFSFNSAPTGRGGALLIGGTLGFAGTTNLAMNQAFLSISNSSCSNNSDQTGSDNATLLDPANLGSNPNGVQYVTTGCCPL